jgi:hypothetical protein
MPVPTGRPGAGGDKASLAFARQREVVAGRGRKHNSVGTEAGDIDVATEVSRSAARGAVGAMAMTGVRTFAGALGIVEETPPEAIAKEAVAGLLSAVPPQRREAAIEFLHWAVGAGGGALFGLVPAAVRKRPWAGPAYGLAMWFGFESMVAPALGLGRHRERRAAERLVLAADHVLYGLILSGIHHRPGQTGTS